MTLQRILVGSVERVELGKLLLGQTCRSSSPAEFAGTDARLLQVAEGRQQALAKPRARLHRPEVIAFVDLGSDDGFRDQLAGERRQLLAVRRYLPNQVRQRQEANVDVVAQAPPQMETQQRGGHDHDDGKEQAMTALHPGDVFAERALQSGKWADAKEMHALPLPPLGIGCKRNLIRTTTRVAAKHSSVMP